MEILFHKIIFFKKNITMSIVYSDYSLDTNTSYALRLYSVLNTDYMTGRAVRHKCSDAIMNYKMFLSLDGSVIDNSDCVMDEIDLSKFSYFNKEKTVEKYKVIMTIISSIFCTIILLLTSFFNCT